MLKSFLFLSFLLPETDSLSMMTMLFCGRFPIRLAILNLKAPNPLPITSILKPRSHSCLLALPCLQRLFGQLGMLNDRISVLVLQLLSA